VWVFNVDYDDVDFKYYRHHHFVDEITNEIYAIFDALDIYELYSGFRFVEYTGDNSIYGLNHNNYLIFNFSMNMDTRSRYASRNVLFLLYMYVVLCFYHLIMTLWAINGRLLRRTFAQRQSRKNENNRDFFIYLNRVDPLYLVFYTHFWHFVVFFINYLSF